MVNKTIIKNPKGQEVGFIDHEVGVYYSKREYSKGQIFRKPEFRSGMGLNASIIEQLEAAGIRIVCFYVPDFERRGFDCIAYVRDFKKLGKLKNYDKKNESNENVTGYGDQYILPMDNFRRAYSQIEQKTIVADMKRDLIRELLKSQKQEMLA